MAKPFDVLDYGITPIPGGPVQITLPTDGRISARFVNRDDHNETLADFTGARSVKASTLLNSLTARRWAQILDYIIPIIAAEKAGLQAEPDS